MVPDQSTVEIEEDFSTFLIYQGKGYSVHENRDPALDETWFTLVVNIPTPDVTADALGYFIGEPMIVLESEFDGDTLIIDLAYA